MAVKKQMRVKHLNEIPAKVHLKAGKLRVVVEIPWSDFERRLGATLKAETRFRKKVEIEFCRGVRRGAHGVGIPARRLG